MQLADPRGSFYISGSIMGLGILTHQKRLSGRFGQKQLRLTVILVLRDVQNVLSGSQTQGLPYQCLLFSLPSSSTGEVLRKV